jgi:hypothetical protein
MAGSPLLRLANSAKSLSSLQSRHGRKDELTLGPDLRPRAAYFEPAVAGLAP